MPADDAELLRRTANRDVAAFETFVLRHYDGALRYVDSLSTSRPDAEDALQEAFLSVWKSADRFRGDGSARAWLFAIARNALRQGQRLRAGQPSQLESIDDLGAQAGWGVDPNGPSLEKLIVRELVEKSFSQLCPADQEILMLRDVEGFSGTEVAELLDLTLSAMKSRLHRARLRLMAAARLGLDA